MSEAPVPPWWLDEPIAKAVPGFVGLAAAAELSVPQIPLFAERATTDLMRLADAHRLPIIAAPVFIYTGAGTAANDTFLLQIALPIPPDSDQNIPDDRYAIKAFEAFKCLAFDYHGSLHHLGEAYPPAMNALRDAGHTPMEQSREVYKRWIAYDAPQNVTEIQLGVR